MSKAAIVRALGCTDVGDTGNDAPLFGPGNGATVPSEDTTCNIGYDTIEVATWVDPSDVEGAVNLIRGSFSDVSPSGLSYVTGYNWLVLDVGGVGSGSVSSPDSARVAAFVHQKIGGSIGTLAP